MCDTITSGIPCDDFNNTPASTLCGASCLHPKDTCHECGEMSCTYHDIFVKKYDNYFCAKCIRCDWDPPCNQVRRMGCDFCGEPVCGTHDRHMRSWGRSDVIFVCMECATCDLCFGDKKLRCSFPNCANLVCGRCNQECDHCNYNL